MFSNARISIVALILAAVLVLPGWTERIIVVKQDSKEKNQKTNQAKLIEGNNTFAFDVYHRLALGSKNDENLFFSPFSISAALAMTWAGANGETADQMEQTLNFELDQLLLHRTMGQLYQELNNAGKDKSFELTVANALWGQKGYEFLGEFLRLTKKYYDADMHEVDYIRATEKARRNINKWVEDNTNQKIKDLIKPGVLNGLTRLVLTNAIYFKGNWATQFDPDQTAQAPFYLNQDKTFEVDLMYLKHRIEYAQFDTFQMVSLPYKGDRLSMVLLLPDKVDGLAGLEKQLNHKQLKAWRQKMRSREVKVYLPKFKMTAEFSLADTLAKMGMPFAFDRPAGSADFSGMNGKKDLFISEIVHKAFVEVNEEGTEAAAATGVIMELKSIPLPPLVFRADHPFLFMIQDNVTGQLLFLGRLTNPPKK